MDEYLEYVKKIEKTTGYNLSNQELLNNLSQFSSHIIYWNGYTNLTTYVHEEDIFLFHFIDSYTCLYLWQNEWEVIYDVGTGAGLPGMPLAMLFRHKKFVLIESNKRKCELLANLISILQLDNVVVLNKRAEDVRTVDGDCVLSRAVSRLDIVLEITCRILKKGGHNLLMRGNNYLREIKLAQERARSMNYKHVKTHKVTDIPNKLTALVKYRLIDLPPEIYPRRFAKIKRGI